MVALEIGKGGKPVASKLYIAILVLPVESKEGNDFIKQKPYLWKIDLNFGSVIRVTNSAYTGGIPNRSPSGRNGFR
jgi:hypothetical protein